ncbi:MAG: DUF4838 domain-containing protein [Ruminococcaceae bacterium]|nr:DUF4838 domain-containing protein [Oscillospiraceae bacterium]
MKTQTSIITILIPKDAPEQVSYAAKELCHYLSLMSGEIFETTETQKDNQISLSLDSKLGNDEFIITSERFKVNIKGGKRGVIYGVYELLEALGCRFFTATSELIPYKEKIILPELNTHQKPVFEYRDLNYHEATKYSRFAVKCRLNGQHCNIREKHGGHMGYTWFVHSFQNMIDPDIYGEDHPEYFALYNGERVTRRNVNQLCLTNPDVLELAIENVRKVLLENPETRIISISQNDWAKSCECPACRASDLKEGSASGTLLKFVNAIAERLEPEFPEVIFDTLAYNYTRPIPTSGTKARHNVCVRLCSIEACFSHSFESCDQDRSVILPDGSRSDFITDLHNWGSVCDRVYIWDYTTCFSHYPAPHPNWNALQPNMQAFANNNVKGVFEQACGASAGSTDFNELREYIISKLLWDPWTDVQKHIREFTDFYYGNAAPYVREYISYICKVAEDENIHVGFQDDLSTPLFRKEVLDTLQGFIDKAKEAVNSDPIRLHRIGKAELSVRWVRLKRGAMVDNSLNIEEANKFFTDWKSYGLTRIDEWCSPETTYRALLHGLWRGTEFYFYPSDEGDEEL